MDFYFHSPSIISWHVLRQICHYVVDESMKLDSGESDVSEKGSSCKECVVNVARKSVRCLSLDSPSAKCWRCQILDRKVVVLLACCSGIKVATTHVLKLLQVNVQPPALEPHSETSHYYSTSIQVGLRKKTWLGFLNTGG